MRDVEVQPPKPSSQSSSEPPTFHPGQIPSTHEPIQIYQPWSFSRHFRYLVKNGLVTAGTSSLLPPRPGWCLQPASLPLNHPTIYLEYAPIIQELQQHPGAGEDASSAKGPMGRMSTELEANSGWKVITSPNPTPPEQGQPRSCCTFYKTAPICCHEI